MFKKIDDMTVSMKREALITAAKSYFHKNNMDNIKKKLGKRCKSIVHYRRKSETGVEWCIRCRLLNETGGIDTVMVTLDKHPDNMDESSYNEVLKSLSSFNSTIQLEEINNSLQQEIDQIDQEILINKNIEQE